MAIEYRNGKPYYYRKKRQGNKVVSKYVGSGELASIAKKLDRYEHQANKEKKELTREERAFNQQMEKELYQLEQTLTNLFTRVALENGYHKHKRQWRKKRKKME